MVADRTAAGWFCHSNSLCSAGPPVFVPVAPTSLLTKHDLTLLTTKLQGKSLKDVVSAHLCKSPNLIYVQEIDLKQTISVAARGSAADMGNWVKNFFLDNEFEMECLAAGIVAVVLWQIVIKMFLGSKSSRLNLPPGPRNLPLVGAMLSIESADVVGWYTKMAQKYGKIFYYRVGSHNVLVVCSAEGAKEVLRTKDAMFSNRPDSTLLKTTAKYLGVNSNDVAFTSYNEKHKNLKKVFINHFFTASQVKSYEHVRRPEGPRLVEDIEGQMNSKGIVDVSGAIFRLNLNVSCKLIFGRRYTDSLTSESDPIKHCEEIIHVNTNLAFQGNIEDIFPWFAWPANILGLSNEVNLQKLTQLYRRVFGQLIEEHREAKRNHKNYNDGDFLDVLLNFHEKGEISYDALLASLMNLLVGGTGASAAATEWTMLELAKNPDCLTKIQKEIDEVVGKLRRVKESDLPNLPYLHAVVNEALRMHPPAPLLVPHFADEATTLQGFDVPANTTVYVSAGLISVDPDYWKDPLEFYPERFMNSEEKTNVTNGNLFNMFPFGSGRRMCIGSTMGLLSTQMGVAILAHAFDWSPLPGQTKDDIDRTELLNGLNRPKTPLSLCAKPRLNPDVYNLEHMNKTKEI